MSTKSVIISKMVTEKAVKMEKNNVYGFFVDEKSNKDNVKESVEYLYGQRPLKVNIVKRPKKPRRAGKQRKEIYDSGLKIAYVTMDKPLGKIVARS